MNNTKTQQIYEECANKGRNVLFLVLKKKSFEKEIIENLEKELDVKMQQFLIKIEPKIRNVKFDDPEKSLRLILLKGLINILKKMIQENIGELSLDDQKLLEEIMNEDDKSKKSPGKNSKKDNKKEDKNAKQENKSSRQPNPLGAPFPQNKNNQIKPNNIHSGYQNPPVNQFQSTVNNSQPINLIYPNIGNQNQQVNQFNQNNNGNQTLPANQNFSQIPTPNQSNQVNFFPANRNNSQINPNNMRQMPTSCQPNQFNFNPNTGNFNPKPNGNNFGK